MEFGKFFRQKRTSLGISVREFCRRNSLDPSNLSRLELGRVRPPQSKEILDSYAKALDLQPESAQWHTFFELAALENGMISPQIQESQVMRGKLPKIYRQMREQTKYQKSWTTALDIERWADSYGAPSTLPRLVRKLVRSTTKKLVRAEFSAGEGIRRPGFDGIVEASEGNDFVPTGVSVWEIGTDNRPATKAKLDFDKRSEKPPIGLDTLQLVFIFITPRKWVKKNEWCEEKKKRGIWKDVRVYDSSDLEEWLETSTSTDIWFSTLIGRRPEGITDIREHWENLATLANPNFQPDVFLVSRDKDIDTLKKWFEGPAASLIFEAHSSSEVIDFISAYIASVPDDQRDILESRYIIVEDRNAWNLLCTSNSRFVLIPKPSLNLDPEMISGAVRQDHHVLLCSKRFSNESPEPHKLSRVYNYDLEKALIKSGFGEVEARRLADEAGGSLTILKRRLHGVSSINKPDWCKSSEVKDLLPILLLGAWNDTFKGDQKIIATMAERSYQDVLLTANRWLSSYDPVIMRVHSSWSLISRDDSWELLAPNLSAQQLDSFEKIAVEVLSENDPQYDLPANERWFASVKNKTPKVSARLKEGISETLVLLGTEVRSSVISVPISPVSRAERVVRKLATGADWKRWASLNLPLLAEASPEVFLDAVEKDLESPKPQLPILFIENGESFMSSCMHAGLLWALEALAWSPAYLSRSILTLARLAESDPGGKWSNRPINSLIEIFLPWLPQTTATVDQRIIVLEKLIEEMPQVGSKLLLSLLPSSHSSSFHTNRPSWRGWALGWSSHVTNYDYCKETEWCAEKLVQNLAKDDGLWEK